MRVRVRARARARARVRVHVRVRVLSCIYHCLVSFSAISISISGKF